VQNNIKEERAYEKNIPSIKRLPIKLYLVLIGSVLGTGKNLKMSR
jgi:hypothetical protein